MQTEITHGQRKRFYALCKILSIDEDTRKELVLQYSNGTTTSIASSSPFTFEQFNRLLADLQAQARHLKQKAAPFENDRRDKLRKKLLQLGYEMGWTVPTKPEHAHMKPSAINFDRVDTWCRGNKSKFGKPLNEMDYNELNATITQFKIVNKKFLENAKL